MKEKVHLRLTSPVQPCGRFFTKEGVRGYRFGFNGKERDDEGMGGGGSTYDYGFRIYNPQIAKFLSVDPLTHSYPWYTPYQFAGNKPIAAIDLDGLEEFFAMDGSIIGAGNPDDKRKLLVLNSETALSIAKMTAEQRATLMETKPSDIVIAPNAEFIKKIQAVYDKGTDIEYGFGYGINKEGQLVFSKIYPGEKESWNPQPALDELNSMEGVTVLGFAHSHPSAYEITKEINGNPISIKVEGAVVPSEEDKANQADRIRENIVQMPGIVIGTDYKLGPDLLAQSPAYGNAPNKVTARQNVNFYGGDTSEKNKGQPVSFKELSKTAKKIYGGK